jgi:hypothetical protein
VLVKDGMHSLEALKHTGSCVVVEGEMKASPEGASQKAELHATAIKFVGPCAPAPSSPARMLPCRALPYTGWCASSPLYTRRVAYLTHDASRVAWEKSAHCIRPTGPYSAVYRPLGLAPLRDAAAVSPLAAVGPESRSFTRLACG